MEKPSKGSMIGLVEDEKGEAGIALNIIGIGTALFSIPAAMALLEQLDLLLEQHGAFDGGDEEGDDEDDDDPRTLN